MNNQIIVELKKLTQWQKGHIEGWNDALSAVEEIIFNNKDHAGKE